MEEPSSSAAAIAEAEKNSAVLWQIIVRQLIVQRSRHSLIRWTPLVKYTALLHGKRHNLSKDRKDRNRECILFTQYKVKDWRVRW
jgi:hypothetical protein